tara:strand:+ start:356 stop:649 length:294 start_codon:yes stop_codon:yes gene_type:complete
MQSKHSFSQDTFISRAIYYGYYKWESLPDSQRYLLNKIWVILTYKWRWQLVMNVPYLAIFLLHRNVQAVHDFDMNLFEKISANSPLFQAISSLIGIG